MYGRRSQQLISIYITMANVFTDSVKPDLLFNSSFLIAIFNSTILFFVTCVCQ